MNKYLFIFGFVGTALFTACSTSDDLSIEDSSAVDKAKETALIFEAGQNSEVPITLGIGQSRGMTRTPIGDESDNPTSGPVAFTTSESGRYLGVFCLATGTQTGVSGIPDNIKRNYWTDDDQGQLEGLLVRLNNAPAKVDGSGVQFLDADDLLLETPTETPRKYYYPVMDWMKYNFYAYYPYNPKDNNVNLIFESARRLRMEYEIDGSQDLIWGMANLPTSDAFCAKYFRDNNPAEIPQFSFEHKLVQFKFLVKKANSGDVVKVTDMNISNAINKLDIIVANKKPGQESTTGDMKYLGNTLPEASLGIKGSSSNENRFDPDDASTALDVTATTTGDAQEVGYILLPSPAIANDASFKYLLVVTYVCNGDSKVAEIELDPTVHGMETFEAGKIYKIVISI